MKKTINSKYRVFIFIFIGLTITLQTSAQQVISSAGAHAVGTNVQLSWTIGEPVIETFIGTSFTLTQGFQQGKLTVTAIEPVVYNGISISVYPNPVALELILDISGTGSTNLKFHLYSAEGKLIVNKKINNQSEKIKMQDYSAGTYFLEVFSPENKLLQSFKILKN